MTELEASQTSCVVCISCVLHVFHECCVFQVCRSAGYYQHALYLAEQHQQHDWYLKIQLEDIRDYQKALDYIARLDFQEVATQAHTHAHTHTHTHGHTHTHTRTHTHMDTHSHTHTHTHGHTHTHAHTHTDMHTDTYTH